MLDTMPVLLSGALRLRPLQPPDAPHLFALLTHPGVTRHDPLALMANETAAHQFIQRSTQNFLEQRGIQWAITRPPDDQLMGICGLAQWHTQQQWATLNYALHPDFWRQGIMSTAVTAVLQYAFNQLHLHQIEAFVRPDNSASIALLHKLHFQQLHLLPPRPNRLRFARKSTDPANPWQQQSTTTY